MMTESVRKDMQAYGNRVSRARAGYLVGASVGCTLFLVNALSHASPPRPIKTLELSELERDKHSELPTELRTVLFDIGIINESDKPGDVIVKYFKDENFTFYAVKGRECQENRCSTGFYYKKVLTWNRIQFEQWLKNPIYRPPGSPENVYLDKVPLDTWYSPIEPLAASYVFFGRCNTPQSLKFSERWAPEFLLLLIDCLAAHDASEGTPHGIWLNKNGPSINKENVLPR